MEPFPDSPLMTGLVRIYPFCKRLLLHSQWLGGDLTGTQRLALLSSLVLGKMTMTQLAEAIVCSKEQATRAVAPLVEQGLLMRSFDPHNRTRVYIQLTEAGEARMHRQLERCGASLEARFSALSDSERQALTTAFSTIDRFLSRELPKDEGGHP